MYTVKQVADIAGVTVRTMHYYDEIGLLHPSKIGGNGYRYYDDAALFRLQQILLYREMDMELAQIRDILDNPDFNTLKALHAHRRALSKKIDRMEQLIETVDSTIQHLQEDTVMANKKKMFGGLSKQQQDDYTREARLQYGPDTVNDSINRWNNYDADQQQAIMDEGNEIYAALAKAVEQGVPVADQRMQDLINRWHEHIKYFYEPSLDMLRGLSEMYIHAPDFRVKFDALHPDLAETMGEAVKIYVDELETAELERMLAEDDAQRRLSGE